MGGKSSSVDATRRAACRWHCTRLSHLYPIQTVYLQSGPPVICPKLREARHRTDFAAFFGTALKRRRRRIDALFRIGWIWRRSTDWMTIERGNPRRDTDRRPRRSHASQCQAGIGRRRSRARAPRAGSTRNATPNWQIQCCKNDGRLGSGANRP